LDGSEIDVVDVGGEREIVNIDFREEVICSGLAVGCTECCPGGGGPPRDDESEETAIFGAT
jgi:hypothetical protein